MIKKILNKWWIKLIVTLRCSVSIFSTSNVFRSLCIYLLSKFLAIINRIFLNMISRFTVITQQVLRLLGVYPSGDTVKLLSKYISLLTMTYIRFVEIWFSWIYLRTSPKVTYSKFTYTSFACMIFKHNRSC